MSQQLVDLWVKMLDISYQATIAVLFVLAARAVLNRIHAPKRYSSVLWAIPFLRLALPIQPESVLSLLPQRNEPVSEIVKRVTAPMIYKQAENAVRSKVQVMPAIQLQEPAASPMQTVLLVFAVLWIAGILILAVYGMFSAWQLRRKLCFSVCEKDNIYLVDDIPSAFVMGLFRAKIYLPSDISESAKKYVIAHEKMHVRRADHITKMIVYLLLCVYWMNPVLWIAYGFFQKDVELACDEGVIEAKDEIYRKSYATALLALSAEKKKLAGIPLAFAENSPKERVQKIISYKKPGVIAGVIGVALILILAAGLLTNPKTEESKEKDVTQKVAEETTAEVSEPEKEIIEVTVPEMQKSAVKEDATVSNGGNVTHREGFQEVKLHYYAPESYAYIIEEVDEEERERLAQEAMQELYDLTGTQIEECYYCVYSGQNYVFGQTKDDLERDRIFYSRRGADIASIDIASMRRVWYSPVDMMIYPEKYRTMTEDERAAWFVVHSGLYNGQPIAEAYQPYSFDPDTWRIVMADDTAYEVTLDSEADIVGSIYGPYPTSDIQH